jgi:hypothetical protein
MRRDLGFTTTIVPDLWTDIDRVLRAMPRQIDLRRVPGCLELAVLAKSMHAVELLHAMRSAGERYYLPLFFDVLRAVCPRPPVAAERHKTARIPEAMFELPW